MEFDTSKWSVKTILGMIGSKELILQPDYQRFYIWDLKKEQGLIDSLLRGFPIPPIWIWTHADEEGEIIYEVIDGQQRLTCIQRFIQNAFIFKELPQTPGDIDLSLVSLSYFDAPPAGTGFAALPMSYRTKLKGYTIPYIEVKTEDRLEIIDIFKRLNKSATNLNPQEMRNAFYTGAFKTSVYKLTSELQDDGFWGKSDRVFSKPTTDRMANQQFVSDLFIAMYRKEPQHQSLALDEFYDTYDGTFPDGPKLHLRTKKCLRLLKKIFPDSSRFTKNLSDFYTLFLYLDELYDSADISLDAENEMVIDSSIRKFELDYAAYLERRSIDKSDSSIFERYRETIVGRQREKEARDARRQIIDELIRPGLKFKKMDPVRLFSEEQKHYIWETSIDKQCAICSKKVEAWDDYEPDHIVSWQKGGRTSIDNGQVSHISCNRRKGGKKA